MALLSILRDIHVSNEKVLNKFTSISRNLDFVLLKYFLPYNRQRVVKICKVYLLW